MLIDAIGSVAAWVLMIINDIWDFIKRRKGSKS